MKKPFNERDAFERMARQRLPMAPDKSLVTRTQHAPAICAAIARIKAVPTDAAVTARCRADLKRLLSPHDFSDVCVWLDNLHRWPNVTWAECKELAANWMGPGLLTPTQL